MSTQESQKHTPHPWKVVETENYAEIYGAIPNFPPIALVQSSAEDIRLISSAPILREENEKLKAALEKEKGISSVWASMAGKSDGELTEAIYLLNEASTANFNSNLGARIKAFITKTSIQNGN